MPNAEDLERRTVEYVEMLRQLRGAGGGAVPDPAMAAAMRSNDPFKQEAFRAALDRLAEETGAGKAAAEQPPAAARAALAAADELLGRVAVLVEHVSFKGDSEIAGWHAGTVLDAARLDVAAARRRIRAVLRVVGGE